MHTVLAVLGSDLAVAAADILVREGYKVTLASPDERLEVISKPSGIRIVRLPRQPDFLQTTDTTLKDAAELHWDVVIGNTDIKGKKMSFAIDDDVISPLHFGLRVIGELSGQKRAQEIRQTLC